MLSLMPIDPEWVAWGARYRWHVEQLPIIVEALREMRVPSLVAPTDQERVQGSSSEGSVPIRLDAIDAVDELWAVLAEYVEEVAELVGEAPPFPVARARRRGSAPAGVRGWSTPASARHAVEEVVRWLLERGEEIAGLAQMQESEEHLFALVRRHRGRYVAERTRARRRVCPVVGCGEQAVVVEWAASVDGRPRPVARCSSCGTAFVQAEGSS